MSSVRPPIDVAPVALPAAPDEQVARTIKLSRAGEPRLGVPTGDWGGK